MYKNLKVDTLWEKVLCIDKAIFRVEDKINIQMYYHKMLMLDKTIIKCEFCNERTFDVYVCGYDIHAKCVNCKQKNSCL